MMTAEEWNDKPTGSQASDDLGVTRWNVQIEQYYKVTNGKPAYRPKMTPDITGRYVLARDYAALAASITDPMANPRVVALVELIAYAQQIIDPCYPASHADWQNKARAALAAIRTGGDT